MKMNTIATLGIIAPVAAISFASAAQTEMKVYRDQCNSFETKVTTQAGKSSGESSNSTMNKGVEVEWTLGTITYRLSTVIIKDKDGLNIPVLELDRYVDVAGSESREVQQFSVADGATEDADLIVAKTVQTQNFNVQSIGGLEQRVTESASDPTQTAPAVDVYTQKESDGSIITTTVAEQPLPVNSKGTQILRETNNCVSKPVQLADIGFKGAFKNLKPLIQKFDAQVQAGASEATLNQLWANLVSTSDLSLTDLNSAIDQKVADETGTSSDNDTDYGNSVATAGNTGISSNQAISCEDQGGSALYCSTQQNAAGNPNHYIECTDQGFQPMYCAFGTGPQK